MDQNAHPLFFKSGTVPFILKDTIECELSRLEKKGIIEAIQYSRWAALIVPVLKREGR